MMFGWSVFACVNVYVYRYENVFSNMYEFANDTHYTKPFGKCNRCKKVEIIVVVLKFVVMFTNTCII